MAEFFTISMQKRILSPYITRMVPKTEKGNKVSKNK